MRWMSLAVVVALAGCAPTSTEPTCQDRALADFCGENATAICDDVAAPRVPTCECHEGYFDYGYGEGCENVNRVHRTCCGCMSRNECTDGTTYQCTMALDRGGVVGHRRSCTSQHCPGDCFFFDFDD